MKTNSGKKSVLIIDDLDRLDPEHIFRILNIFSAFQDQHKETNKFGFDKVILVFDVENVRSIFRHKYGSGADFSGYLDKFYSQEIFWFDNELLKRHFVNITSDPRYQNAISLGNKTNLYIFEFICNRLIKHNLLNYRILNDFSAKILSGTFIKAPFIEQTPILLIYNTLNSLYDRNFKEILFKLKIKDINKGLKDLNHNSENIQNLEKILCTEIYYKRHSQKFNNYKSITSDTLVAIDKFTVGHLAEENILIKINYMSDIWALFIEYLDEK
jgi:hypothetical protein